MARNVFYSFHYQKDISRVMVVRKRWVTYGSQSSSGIIDHAEFEKIQRRGKLAVENWIDSQLAGTSATVVLIGEETLRRPYVQYEIMQSKKRGNAIVGVYINQIRDLYSRTSLACSPNVIVGYEYGVPVWFSNIAQGIYDYVDDNGYEKLDIWVDNAVRKLKYGF